jgi:hypothetical protein
MLLKNYNRNWEVVLKKKRANNFAGNIKLSRWKQTYYSFSSDQNPILLSGVRKKSGTKSTSRTIPQNTIKAIFQGAQFEQTCQSIPAFLILDHLHKRYLSYIEPFRAIDNFFVKNLYSGT